MPGNPREMIITAERTFPVRIRIAVPPEGLGQRHPQITAWLDENCGSDRWAMTPSGMRGVLNDAISIYFADATLANAFVLRCASGPKPRRQEPCSWCGRRVTSQGAGACCYASGSDPAPGAVELRCADDEGMGMPKCLTFSRR